MTPARWLELALGLALALVTLRDLFSTVVVPGHSRGLLQVSRRLVLGLLPLWKRWRHRGVGTAFAPAALVASFAIWMLLLILAFGLMLHAVRESFTPALASFGQALYAAGAAMTTIGLGAVDAQGAGAALIVVAGLCGLGAMTLAVTYLLEVQSNIAVRDAGVLKITTAAGQPPSAVELLERYAGWRARDETGAVLREGREWCAAVLQSHVSHPWLIYFRSAGTGPGWPAALGALMDAALIVEVLLDRPGDLGPAVLARLEADRLAQGVCDLVGLGSPALAPSLPDAQAACERLERAGYRLRPDRDVAGFAQLRAHHLAPVEALSRHLGTPSAPLVR